MAVATPEDLARKRKLALEAKAVPDPEPAEDDAQAEAAAVLEKSIKALQARFRAAPVRGPGGKSSRCLLRASVVPNIRRFGDVRGQP